MSRWRSPRPPRRWRCWRATWRRAGKPGLRGDALAGADIAAGAARAAARLVEINLADAAGDPRVARARAAVARAAG